MKITGWTWCGDPEYVDIDDSGIQYDSEELRNLIVSELRNRGYKFTGFYHQGGEYGTPIIDDKYTALYSFRSWGGIIEDAYPLHPGDNMAYCYWAWTEPDGEKEIVPCISDSGYPFNSATGDSTIATTNRSNMSAPNLRLLKR